MHKVALHYALTHTTGDRGLRHPLMDLLAAVARGGSISAAARDLGMSYRHAWGELKRWEGELANALIIEGSTALIINLNRRYGGEASIAIEGLHDAPERA